MSQQLIDWNNKLLPSLQENINIILKYLPDNGILYDIGANTGAITEEILKVKPNIEAYLFEPVTEIYEFCRDKFKDNPNITVENLALSNVNGKCKVHTHGDNRGFNQIELTEEDSGIKTRTLLDHVILNKLPYNIDFIKIDVEGHEVQVLEGISYYLLGASILGVLKLPYILCEIGWYRDKEDEMFNTFKELYGYEIERFDRDVLLKPLTI